MRIHPDGWKFIGIFALGTLFLWMLSTSFGWIGLILTAWCMYFFRHPVRVTPARRNLMVSPADGKIVAIKSVVPPKNFEMGDGERIRISIFLNVFDVHVNRIPLGGIIKKVIYHQGRFFNASLDKASEHNERNTLVIAYDDKGSSKLFAVTQIAGLIARRIRCDVNEGDPVATGEGYGLIRFGSRADIYLPLGINPLVIEGQYMIAGETVLADLESTEEPRKGSSH